MALDSRYLIKIKLKNLRGVSATLFPYNLPVVRDIECLKFHSKVTFFVGENGSGKSTILESVAAGFGINPEGGNRNTRFSSRDTHSELYRNITLVRGVRRPTDWFFLRAESFYNVASYMDDVGYLGGYGGNSIHQQSHGESFLTLLNHKLKGGGLYLFDEPEAALSPSKQLATLKIIHELVEKQSQIIVATHSPIIMAYPHSRIYQFSDAGITEIKYEETEHFLTFKDFINNYKYMLKCLLET